MAATMSEEKEKAVPDRDHAREIIGDIAGMLNDTRHTMLMVGYLLGGLTLGIAMEAALAPAPLGTGLSRVLGVVLLASLVLSWLRSVGLLVLAGRPILGIVNNQRWKAGAPLDPRARWLHLPSIDATPQEWTWVRAHMLLGAARIRMTRVQSALTWSFITIGLFLAWTVLVIVTT
jgi:hypothetical protein